VIKVNEDNWVQCQRCLAIKPALPAYWSIDNREGLRGGRCRACVNEDKRDFSRTKKDHQAHHRLYHWKLSPEAYAEKLAAQGGVCAICGAPPKNKSLNVDHDHRCCPGSRSCGKCVRDLLCNWCNIAGGYLADPRIELVRAYRERHAQGS